MAFLLFLIIIVTYPQKSLNNNFNYEKINNENLILENNFKRIKHKLDKTDELDKNDEIYFIKLVCKKPSDLKFKSFNEHTIYSAVFDIINNYGEKYYAKGEGSFFYEIGKCLIDEHFKYYRSQSEGFFYVSDPLKETLIHLLKELGFKRSIFGWKYQYK